MALTVLIVEDEQSASRLLSAIAAEVGLSARATASAREAQEMCAQAAASGQPFSAVVLGLVLSELDGVQFAHAARAASLGEELPLIRVGGGGCGAGGGGGGRVPVPPGRPGRPRGEKGARSSGGAQPKAPPGGVGGKRPAGGFSPPAVRGGRRGARPPPATPARRAHSPR